ncbi:putative GNAT family acetyltransferase [Mytilinidion resinicola]|uniref:GNAT family acetyltransferase n=1 Tax=Mytilinidion resinicola TaxID=574789 RepID=A0A6A6XXM3_9PEZI|nr:putative GNAT family acetyltransferase [Mytilinidion resinicola]KAF2801291.1 putative GNAT family acetyltransferase [Mytilinidion resinicola]
MPSTQDGGDSYNFCFPIDASKLSNDRLSLVPFDSDYARFSTVYVSETCKAASRNFDYLAYGPFENVDAFGEWYEPKVRSVKSQIWFAIILKKCVIRDRQIEDGTFAGTVALMDCNRDSAIAEIAHVNYLPKFQRTFVGSNVNGLLLHYALDAPPNGLGLRRVQWHANGNNKASIVAAQRMGFRFEGIIRWHRVLPAGKEGNGAGEEDLPPVVGKKLGPGRHTASLSICWDDWKDGARDKVDALMNR